MASQDNEKACGRQSAREVLLERIRRIESQLAPLKMLEQMIPWGDLTPQEEQSMWDFFIDRRYSA